MLFEFLGYSHFFVENQIKENPIDIFYIEQTDNQTIHLKKIEI